MDISWNNIREDDEQVLLTAIDEADLKREVDLGRFDSGIDNSVDENSANCVIDAELDHLLGSSRHARAACGDRERLIGIALSGGGIRSASFSLGVLQAMANADQLKHAHYLSTVSGGGYIGSSLSWYIGRGAHENARHPDPIPDDETQDGGKAEDTAKKSDNYFDVSKNYFPFGAKEHSILATREDSWRRDENVKGKQKQQATILDHIRQEGNYLSPKGGGDLIAAFVATLRFIVPSFIVYFCTFLLPVAFIAYCLALPTYSLPTLLNPDTPSPTAANHILRIADHQAGTSDENSAEVWLADAPDWLKYNAAWRLSGFLFLAFILGALVYALFSGSPKALIRSNSLFSISFSLFTLAVIFVFSSLVYGILFYVPDKQEIYVVASLFLAVFAASFTYSHIAGPLSLLILNIFAILSLNDSSFYYQFLPDSQNIYSISFIFFCIVTIFFFSKINKYKIESDKEICRIKRTLLRPIAFFVFAILFDIICFFFLTSLNDFSTSSPLFFSFVSGVILTIIIVGYLIVHGSPDDDSDIIKDAYDIRKNAASPGKFLVALAGTFFILGLLPIIYKQTFEAIGPSLTAAGIAAYVGKIFLDIRDIKQKFAGFENLLILIACLGSVIGLLLLGFALCDVLYDYHKDSWLQLGIVVLLMAISAGLVGWQANVNFVGFHRFYRDRLMQTFFPSADPKETGDAAAQARNVEGFFVHQLRHASRAGDRRGPYHIINTNVLLADSNVARYRGRGGASFIISPLFSGCDATGWRASNSWRMPSGTLTLATAMAVSGAAINPRTGPSGRGPMRTSFVSLLMTLFNARLGLWVTNPRKPLDERPRSAPNFILPGIFPAMGFRLHHEDHDYIELTDGAHFDNTGLYELIRRNVKLIILVDGSDDKEFNYSGLASAFQRIRADFGVQIRFDKGGYLLKNLMHDAKDKGAFAKRLHFADKGFALARIDYQPHDDDTNRDRSEDGLLVIIKAAMIAGLPADVLGYKSAHPDFPNESTTDQFFDETQLEAYRELGYRLGRTALEDKIVKDEFAYCTTGRPPPPKEKQSSSEE